MTTIFRKPKMLTSTGPVTQQVSQQVTQQVSRQVVKLLSACVGELSRAELMRALALRDRVSFSRNYLEPALLNKYFVFKREE